MSIRRFIIALGVIGLGSFGSALAADMPAKAPIYTAPPVAMYNWTGFYVGFNLSGGMAGGTVGYNWQSSNIVVGLEADWDWANIHGSTTTFCAVGCDTKITSFGTLRPRIGMTWDNFLFYVTGGLAWDTVKAGRPGFTSNNTRAGWTIGGGAEAFIMPDRSNVTSSFSSVTCMRTPWSLGSSSSIR